MENPLYLQISWVLFSVCKIMFYYSKIIFYRRILHKIFRIIINYSWTSINMPTDALKSLGFSVKTTNYGWNRPTFENYVATFNSRNSMKYYRKIVEGLNNFSMLVPTFPFKKIFNLILAPREPFSDKTNSRNFIWKA